MSAQIVYFGAAPADLDDLEKYAPAPTEALIAGFDRGFVDEMLTVARND